MQDLPAGAANHLYLIIARRRAALQDCGKSSLWKIKGGVPVCRRPARPPQVSTRGLGPHGGKPRPETARGRGFPQFQQSFPQFQRGELCYRLEKQGKTIQIGAQTQRAEAFPADWPPPARRATEQGTAAPFRPAAPLRPAAPAGRPPHPAAGVKKMSNTLLRWAGFKYIIKIGYCGAEKRGRCAAPPRSIASQMCND